MPTMAAVHREDIRHGRTIFRGLLTVVVAVGITAAVLVIARWKGVSFATFSRDPAAALHGLRYAGYFSNLGVLIWASGASAALIAAVALRPTRHREAADLLLAAGGVTGLMVLDDLFLLHEEVYDTVVPQAVVIISYAVLTAAFAWRYRRRLRADLLLIVGAYGFWGISGIIDVRFENEATVVLEDGAKFVGICVWTVMLCGRALRELRTAILAGQVGETERVRGPRGMGRHASHRLRGEGGRGATPAPID
jgi:hypothetical protein